MAREQIIQNSSIGYQADSRLASDRASSGFSDSRFPVSKRNSNGREEVNDWHKPATKIDNPIGTVGNFLNGTKEMAEQSLSVGTKVLGTTVNQTAELIKNGSKNKNLSDIVKASIGAVFGLGFIKDILGVPKIISDSQYREKQSPFVINAAKWVTGGTLAFGLLRGVMGGAGLSAIGISTGLVAFIVPYILSKIYENENSIFSKLASAMGLRERINDLIGTLKFGNVSQ